MTRPYYIGYPCVSPVPVLSSPHELRTPERMKIFLSASPCPERPRVYFQVR